LHIKPASRDITVSVLQSIYRTVFADKPELILPNGDFYVINRILHVADEITQDGNETPELEIKVILAMAIRLKAEQFMIAEINDEPFVHSIQ